MKKIVLSLSKIIISVIFIVILKIFIHYFILPSSKATFDENVPYHTVIKNPDYRKYDRLNKDCKRPCKIETGTTYGNCDFYAKKSFGSDWQFYPVSNREKTDFLLNIYSKDPGDTNEPLDLLKYDLILAVVRVELFVAHSIITRTP